jgi:hypothetical protein
MSATPSNKNLMIEHSPVDGPVNFVNFGSAPQRRSSQRIRRNSKGIFDLPLIDERRPGYLTKPGPVPVANPQIEPFASHLIGTSMLP